MADDEIETVDLDEVQRLERVIAEREATEKLQPPDRRPMPDPQPHYWHGPELDGPCEDCGRKAHDPVHGGGKMKVSRAVDQAPAAPQPLVPFISAEAVDQRLQALSAHLQQIEAQTRHTMLLVMILAERMNLTSQEYERALALAQRSEQAAKGQS